MVANKYVFLRGFLNCLGILLFLSIYAGIIFLAAYLVFDKSGVGMNTWIEWEWWIKGLAIVVVLGAFSIYTALMFLILFAWLKKWDKWMGKQIGDLLPEPHGKEKIKKGNGE